MLRSPGITGQVQVKTLGTIPSYVRVKKAHPRASLTPCGRAKVRLQAAYL
jgi:hypothetical protein